MVVEDQIGIRLLIMVPVKPSKTTILFWAHGCGLGIRLAAGFVWKPALLTDMKPSEILLLDTQQSSSTNGA
jgi:hypothetical protein